MTTPTTKNCCQSEPCKGPSSVEMQGKRVDAVREAFRKQAVGVGVSASAVTDLLEQLDALTFGGMAKAGEPEALRNMRIFAPRRDIEAAGMSLGIDSKSAREILAYIDRPKPPAASDPSERERDRNAFHDTIIAASVGWSRRNERLNSSLEEARDRLAAAGQNLRELHEAAGVTLDDGVCDDPGFVRFVAAMKAERDQLRASLASAQKELESIDAADEHVAEVQRENERLRSELDKAKEQNRYLDERLATARQQFEDFKLAADSAMFDAQAGKVALQKDNASLTKELQAERERSSLRTDQLRRLHWLAWDVRTKTQSEQDAEKVGIRLDDILDEIKPEELRADPKTPESAEPPKCRKCKGQLETAIDPTWWWCPRCGRLSQKTTTGPDAAPKGECNPVAQSNGEAPHGPPLPSATGMPVGTASGPGRSNVHLERAQKEIASSIVRVGRSEFGHLRNAVAEIICYLREERRDGR